MRRRQPPAYPCVVCGQPRRKNGMVWLQHMFRHVREGRARQFFKAGKYEFEAIA